MKTRLTLFLVPALSAAGVVLCFGDARAAGTALDAQSARGTAMAAAMTAAVDDSSAVFYNTAGMARGRGLDAQVGITLVAPSFKFTNPSGKSTSMPFYVVPPPNAYVTYGITDDLTVGLGVFSPFGSAVQWPDGWEGRRVVTKASYATFDFNPSVAYRIGPVRFGAGLQIVRGTVELEKDVAFGSTEGSTKLGGGAWAVGGNGGVQVDAIEKYLTLGAHYRSATKLNFDDAKAHFEGVPSSFSSILHDQTATTSLINPQSLTFGVASRPINTLLLDLDVAWTNWSTFRAIDVAFPNDKSGGLAIHEPKNWHDTVNVRLGAEGTLNETWRVRGGVLFDPTPQPASTLLPDLTDTTRLDLAVGGSYHHPSGFHVDLGYLLVLLLSQTSTSPIMPGEYGGFANVLGLSVGYAPPRAKAPTAAPAPAL